MMQSKEKITRANAMDIIRRFAKEYEPPPPCGAEPRPVEVVSKPLRVLETLRFSDF